MLKAHPYNFYAETSKTTFYNDQLRYNINKKEPLKLDLFPIMPNVPINSKVIPIDQEDWWTSLKLDHLSAYACCKPRQISEDAFTH